MGRPRLSDMWVGNIAHLMYVAGITSPTEICKRVEEWGMSHGYKETEIPSRITVIRYVRKLRNEALRRGSEPFRWPDSMGNEDHQVPWEAARHSLDLVRYCADKALPLPTVRVAQWAWRVCQSSSVPIGTIRSSEHESALSGDTGVGNANPKESATAIRPDDDIMQARLDKAAWLAVGEVLEHQGLDYQSSIKGAIELELVFLPERSDEDRLAYEKICEKLGASKSLLPYGHWLDYGDRRVSPLEMIVAVERWRTKKNRSRKDDTDEQTAQSRGDDS